MSVSNGTPSKTVWTPGQCAQIQKAFVGVLPDVLKDLGFHPRDVIEAFRDKDEDLEQSCYIFLSDFVERNLPTFLQIETLSVSIPAFSRPTLKKLQKSFSWIKSIERDTSPTEAVMLNLATVFRPSENEISGKEYEVRISPKLNLILGYQQASWLVEHQNEFPELMKLIGKVYIDFPGLVVVEENGNRHVPGLGRENGRWCLYWRWFVYVSDRYSRYGRVAFSGK